MIQLIQNLLKDLNIFADKLAITQSCFEHYMENFERPSCLLHCGAHFGEEHHEYRSAGIVDIFWNECQPHCLKHLIHNFGERNVLEGCVSNSENETVDFFQTNNSLSSSIRKIQTDNVWGVKVQDPIKVKTVTIDRLMTSVFLRVRKIPSLVVLDLQGNEYEALQSANIAFMKGVSFIVEMSNYELYEGQKLDREIKEFMSTKGYTMVWPKEPSNHYEALFLSRDTYKKYRKLSRQLNRFSRGVRFTIARIVKRMLHKLIYEINRLSQD